jgi:hypothetical protein
MRLVARHAVAWGVTAATIAFLPGVTAELSWRLGELLGWTGGVSFYGRSWRSSGVNVSRIGDVISPFGCGPLGLLLVLLMSSLLAEHAAVRYRWLRWVYPGDPGHPHRRDLGDRNDGRPTTRPATLGSPPGRLGNIRCHRPACGYLLGSLEDPRVTCRT